MNPDIIVDISKDAIYTLLIVVTPVMVTSFIAGIIMSFLQAIFQIHEQTFSFVPKLAVILMTLVVSAPWMLHQIIIFSEKYMANFKVLIQ